MTEDAPPDLRERLVALRQNLIDAMRRDGPQAGWLQMMAGIAATIAALDESDGIEK